MEPTDGEAFTAPEGAESQQPRDTRSGDAWQSGPEPEMGPDAEPDAESLAHADEPRGPQIEIDLVEGDFRVLGGAPHLLLTIDGHDIAGNLAAHQDGVLRFSRLPDESELRVPDGARIYVRQVYEDLTVAHLDGLISAQRIGGDAELLDVAVCDLVQVGGDLEAEKGGQLSVRSVGGDVSLTDYDEPPLVGHVGGDLEARNLPGLDLREAVGGDVKLERCGDVSLVGTIGGDLRAAGTTVTLRASAVGGDVRLDSATGVTLAAAGGDLRVDSASGPIDVHSVGGDAHINATTLLIQLGTVGGDLIVEQALGGLHAGRVGGDVRLDTPLRAGAEYSVQSGGDIELRVRGEVNARFVAQTFGGEIRTRLPLSVERGRRRNLVGVIGRGEATVTLRSGGDISIAADDRDEEEHGMGDEFVGEETKGQEHTDPDSRTWEGNLGGRRFRVRVDRGPGRAHVHFQGPFGVDDDPDGAGAASRDFGFEWERGRGARTYGEYDEKLNDLRGKAERTARKAADQAQEYAERAARRLRETDWESVGREVRGAVEKAIGDLEDVFNQTRRNWEPRSSSGGGDASRQGGARPSGAQRVRIEYDDADAAGAGPTAGAASAEEVEAMRRGILELLRGGTITLDEAERQLNELR
ncbi:MAG: DUF4097 family beta strand repeat-containing protein [Ktedonobacterales bacterium]